jgi:hypothetical protein
MQADLPIFESIEDALRASVQALGGTKQVGHMLWPDKSIDNAGKLVSDCLNPHRNERLEPSQLLLIFRKAREAGCYEPFRWFAAEAGYDASPITRAEEIDRVTLVIEQASKTLATATAALERIQRVRAVEVRA